MKVYPTIFRCPTSTNQTTFDKALSANLSKIILTDYNHDKNK